MKTNKWSAAAAVGGVLLLIAGLYLLRTGEDPQGATAVLPYVCIGIGCGLFGHGTGNLLASWAVSGHPGGRRQMEIEREDERNQAIGDRAKGRAFDIMTYTFGALTLIFAIMGVCLAAGLQLVVAYLFLHGWAAYNRIKYEREM